MRYFCPHCWTTIDVDIDECPSCGFRLADYDAASYETKLLMALKHPVHEHRLLAVQILGRIRSVRAVAAFGQILGESEDYYLMREVLHALATIGTPDALRLLRQAQRHPSRLVREMARELVARTANPRVP